MNYDKERRQQAKHERLGSSKPACHICGENDPRCLERHHLTGRKFDNETVILCRNCHRKLSEDQRDHPKSIGSPPSVAEIVVHALHGIADLLILVAEQCRKFAVQLLQSISGEEYPA